MFIVFIPTILIAVVALGIVGGISQALKVNIMPYISIIFLIIAIVGLVKACVSEEESDKKGAFIVAAICFVFFLFTCTASVTTGDILSWIWYHI